MPNYLDYFRNESRNLIKSDFPYNLQVNTKIIMDDAITESSNSVPINLRICIYYFIRQQVRGFSNNFKIAYNGIDCLIVFRELFK